MRSMKTFVKLICIVALLTFPIMMKPAAADADAADAVEFDSSGKFVDALDNTDYMVYQSGILQTDGSMTGPGEVIYSAGSSDFHSISIDTTFNKWALNYSGHDLAVYETAYDAGTDTFVDGKQVVMARELSPDLMTGKDTDKATYVSGPITPGTKYLRVLLPQADFFADVQNAADYKVDGITLENSAAAAKPVDLTIDKLADFSHFANGTDTSNLSINDLTAADKILDARTFASNHFMERADATKADSSMTYASPEGKEFQSVYVEGYFNFVPSKLFEVWISEDGVNYTNASASSHYITVPFPYNGDWIPTVLKISDLPGGTRYVQIRLPAYTSGELWGMKYPRMTRVVLGSGDPGDATDPTDPDTGNPVDPTGPTDPGTGNPGDPADPGTADPNDPAIPAGPSGPVGEYPAETVISFAAAPVAIDGVVETGENGSLTGDWQGAFAENIAGLVDANGDEHGADVYLKYDYDNLYVGAKIKDPTPMRNTNTGSNIWNGDNMEIFLGTDDLDYALYPDKKQTTIPSDVQIVLSGGIDDGPQFYLYQNGVFTYPNITMGVHQDADGKGYTIEAAIPLSVLGIANSWDSKKVIMNPVLNDGGYDKRGQWGWTTNDEASKKSRGQWGLAALEPADAPQVEISANASVEINTNVVTVAGQTANVQSRDVTILVTDANENIAYIDQTLSDAQGNYSFTFPVNSDAFGAGIYTATVGGEGIVRTNAAAFTLAADTAAPAEVTNIGVSAGNGKLTLTWSDPANADYDYALVRVLGQTSAPVMVGKGVQQVEIGSLTNGTEYTAAIQTVDLSGNISQGMEAKGTPVIPSTPTADTAAPAEVTNTEVSAGSGMLTLTWTDPADADYDHAVVRVQGQSAAPVIVTKGEQRIEIGSLANGTEYTVAIQTVDLTGNISPGIEVKGTPVSPSTPSTSSGNASTAPETDKDTVIVDLKDKKPDQNGQVTVELPKDAAVLQIAVDQISIVGSGGLLVKAGNAEIAIPAEVLADAAKLGDGNGAYIAIHVDQHANGDQTDAADKMSSDNLKVKLFGDGFKLQVSLVNKDGVSKELTRFSKTVSIAMPAAGGEADPELLGVYFYNEQTKQLEYIGGHIDENGLLTFDLVKPGVYQVVEYDKLFLDVPSGHWANRAVKVLSARHIVNGMTENAFKPNQQITRADFAVLLANVLGLKPEQQTSFTDVDPGSYYAGAVAALFEAKLISGRGDNQFDPTATITREEMILLIVHAFEFKTGTALDTGSESFADSSSISVWAQDAVSAAKQAGLINGRGSNEFDPKAGSARSDTAQLIYNFLKQMER